MKNLIYGTILAILFGVFSCEKVENTSNEKQSTTKSADVTLLKINNSKIYKIEKAAIWTTTLNQLQVITKFVVTANTVIYLDNVPTKVELLKPGFKVTLYYYEEPLCTGILPCYIAIKILAFSK